MPLTQTPRLFYTDTGAGTPVVFSHSLLLDTEHFAPMLPAITERARVIAIDSRNHGQSDHVDGPCTLEEKADDLIGVLDHLGIERAVIAGLSMGGMIGMRIALRYPQRVAGLFLMNTSADRDTPFNRIKYEGLVAMARAVWPHPRLLAEVTKLFVGAIMTRERPEIVERVAAKLRSQPVQPLIPSIRAVSHRPSIVPALSRISVPTTVIAGAEDIATPPRYAAQIAAAIPGARLHEIPECGHLSTLEKPDEVSAHLLDLLAEVDG